VSAAEIGSASDAVHTALGKAGEGELFLG